MHTLTRTRTHVSGEWISSVAFKALNVETEAVCKNLVLYRRQLQGDPEKRAIFKTSFAGNSGVGDNTASCFVMYVPCH
jgi:hypothetical protein